MKKSINIIFVPCWPTYCFIKCLRSIEFLGESVPNRVQFDSYFSQSAFGEWVYLQLNLFFLHESLECSFLYYFDFTNRISIFFIRFVVDRMMNVLHFGETNITIFFREYMGKIKFASAQTSKLRISIDKINTFSLSH